MMKIVFLSENKTNKSDFLAEHGLSIYIETQEMKILFDAGASELFIKNAENLNVDLEKIDNLIISHGHYDHTQGVPSFCEMNENAKIYLHEDLFTPAYSIENGKLEEKNCGIRWSISQLDRIKERFILTKGVTKLTDNIVISGTIPLSANFKPTEKFYRKKKNGNLEVDPMEHEQFLIIRNTEEGISKGIYIFSGCSHRGIIPCINYARELFPGEKISGLIAGMHLYNSNKEVRNEIITQLMAEDIGFVIPVHCTGIDAICDIKILFGDKCIVAGAGDTYEL